MSSSVRYGAVLVILALGAIQLQLGLKAQHIFSNETPDGSTQVSDVKAVFKTAREKYLFAGDLDMAASLLRRTLEQRPYYIPAWLLLAEIEYDRGGKVRANAILDYVDSLTHDVKKYRWDKALVAYQFDRREMLAQDLSYIAREIGGETGNEALRLAFSIWEDPDDLVKALGEDSLMVLFLYAARKPHLDEALSLWQRVESGHAWREPDVLVFIDMLFNMGRVREASKIWKKHFNPDHIIHDGSFTTNFQKHAFTWRNGTDRSFRYSFDPPRNGSTGRSLHYRFTGWDNSQIEYLSQISPVQGGKYYTLTLEIKTENLTTDQRPYVEVGGYNCGASQSRVEMVEPEQNWHRYVLQFMVPEGCEAMVIRLKRNESLQIDNRLSGDLWLRDVKVRPFEQHRVMEEFRR